MRQNKRRIVGALICALIVLAACSDSQLGKLADALDVVTTSMAIVQKTTIAANATVPPLVSTPTATVILTLSQKVNKATLEAVTATKAVAKLDDQTNANLTGIIAPIVKAVDDVVKDPAIAGIQDQATRDKIRLGLLSVQTTLATTQTILAASKK